MQLGLYVTELTISHVTRFSAHLFWLSNETDGTSWHDLHFARSSRISYFRGCNSAPMFYSHIRLLQVVTCAPVAVLRGSYFIRSRSCVKQYTTGIFRLVQEYRFTRLAGSCLLRNRQHWNGALSNIHVVYSYSWHIAVTFITDIRF